MASLDVDLDGELFVDPDEVKVPESPRHRRVVELVGSMTGLLVAPDQICYRDMNWYPPDGESAVAPDVMVLGSSVLPVGAKSYQQRDGATMPSPLVVVEVPSASDGWSPFWAKALRYQRLGVVLYVINVDDGPPDAVMRLGPDDSVLRRWTNQPIPELGSLVVDSVDGDIVVRSPSGDVAGSSAEALLGALIEQRDALAAELE